MKINMDVNTRAAHQRFQLWRIWTCISVWLRFEVGIQHRSIGYMGFGAAQPTSAATPGVIGFLEQANEKDLYVYL